MRKITLPQDVRTFRRTGAESSSLYQTEDWVEAGTKLVVSDPMLMHYDHGPQQAVSFKDDDGKEHFLIVKELGIDGFVQ